jgi:hypothetical protein
MFESPQSEADDEREDEGNRIIRKFLQMRWQASVT